MLVLSGPPGCGNSRQVLEQIRGALRRGAENFRLIVPTPGSAVRLRHQLAREGYLVRPGAILSLPEFIDSQVSDLPQPGAPVLEVLIEGALERAARPEFERVRALAGFRASLVRLVEELSTSGCDSRRLARLLETHALDAPFAQGFTAVFQDLEREVSRRGWALPLGRIAQAQERIRDRGLAGLSQVFFDGFLSFTDPELDLLGAISSHADVTVTLPLWPGSQASRAALLMMGFTEKESGAGPPPEVALVRAPDRELEAGEIARRVLDHVAAGRRFDEIAILVRDAGNYVPLLRAVFERFGIPARFHFGEPLASHSVVRYLTGIIEAMLAGWDHERMIPVIRAGPSGFANTAAGDLFDFTVRERLPGKGLKNLRDCTQDGGLRALLDRFEAIDSWRAFRLTPPVWVSRTKVLRAFVQSPPATGGSRAGAGVWRSRAAALEAFDAVIDETAEALGGDDTVTFSEFWRAAKVLLEGETLGERGSLHNAVNVLPFAEARPCSFPVVFLCGLAEQQFPFDHLEDPILPDEARLVLRRAGLRLPTSGDLRRLEELLFALATAWPASDVTLSYPQQDGNGGQSLPSPLVHRWRDTAVSARAWRPPSSAAAAPPRAAAIQAPDLLAHIRRKHSTLESAAIDDFLQCPFRFFAFHTLELGTAPPPPAERLERGLENRLVRAALNEARERQHAPDAVFTRLFAEACLRNRLAVGYRTELARLRMLRDLRRATAEAFLLEGWQVETGKTVQFCLEGVVDIRAHAGRVHIGPPSVPEPQAVLVCVSYEPEQTIRALANDCEQGRMVSGALSLLALENQLGYQPAGLLFFGFRGGFTAAGWHVPLPALDSGAEQTVEGFRQMLGRAKAMALRAFEEIGFGRTEAAPTDLGRCACCPVRDVCRVSADTEVAAAGASLE